jgi:hypothetical protein
MTREDFRREIGDAFDSISGSPSPAMPDRVRAALIEAPERRGPVWIAALAAAVIAVVLVGVLLVANPLNRGPLTSGGLGTTSPTPCSATCPTPQPSPSPNLSPAPSFNPSPAPSPGFTCVASPLMTMAKPAPTAFIDALRTGTHTGYDRITIEFQNGQPQSLQLRPQTGTTFTRDARGDKVTLDGRYGILVIIKGADSHTSYSGSADIKTNYSGLRETRNVGDFEGTVQWALGLASSPCYHAYILDNPTRLVIDLKNS